MTTDTPQKPKPKGGAWKKRRDKALDDAGLIYVEGYLPKKKAYEAKRSIAIYADIAREIMEKVE
jgi:hypothetical protein